MTRLPLSLCLALLLSALPSLAKAAEPLGHVDRVANNTLLGWSVDPDAPSANLQLHVYRDGHAGAGGVFVTAGQARFVRPDVNAATGHPGRHGFQIPLPASLRDGRQHRLYVYAIDAKGGTNPLLRGSGLSYGSGSAPPPAAPSPSTPAPPPQPPAAPPTTPASPSPPSAPTSSADPIGSLDRVSGGIASGWALDADAPRQSLVVHIYADAPVNQGGRLIGSARADRPRPDVNAYSGEPGDHGFAFNVPPSAANAKLFVYAINLGPGKHTLLGGAGASLPPTPDPTAPSLPLGLAGSAPSGSRVTLRWQAASDPESGVREYRVYRDGAQVGTSTSLEFTDRGLSPSTSYTYEISALNGAGMESLRSASQSVMTGTRTTKVEDYIATIPKGNYCYIDDLVHSLSADIGGDTNASQDWVATLLLGVHFNEMPRFLGATAARRGTSKIGPELSMGIPVYRGSPNYLDYSETDLSRRIVAEARKGPFTVVAGGPHTDIYVALRSDPSITPNLKVIVFTEWNEEQDPQATAYVRNRLGSRFVTYGKGEYLGLIKHPFPADKPAWIDSLRFNDTWDRANTPFVLNRNTELNRNYGGVRHYRLADVMLAVRRRHTKATSMDARAVIPMLERGARLIQNNTR